MSWKQRVIKFFVYSLSGRLFLVFLLTSFLLVLVINAVGQSFVRDRMEGHFHPHVRQYVYYIREDIGVPPDFDRAEELSERTSSPIRIRGPDGLEWYSDDDDDDFPDTSRARRIKRRSHDLYVGSFGVVAEFYFSGYRYAFYLSDEEEELRFNHFLWVLLGLLWILVVGSYVLVRYQIAPLGEIRRGIERVGLGEWDEPVKKVAMGELGDLGRGINGMAERIGRMVQGKRFLLLAMSHELKTPLTSMRVNVELMEDSEEKVRLSKNIAVMEDMISRLLLSERLGEGGGGGGERSAYNVARGLRLLEEEEEGVDFSVKEEGLYVDIEEEEWKVLVRNLVRNAKNYSVDGCLIPYVELVREGEMGVLRVMDDGEGVDEEELAHLGEAFYRGDTSRTRATGGTGLGLYLCRLIVEKLGGTISFLRLVGVKEVGHKGLCVEVRLPLKVGLTEDEA